MNKNGAIHTKKISRRDALKLLTAVTGATALANAPARWSKPGLKIGMLPAHAQTSVITTPHTLKAGDDDVANFCGSLTTFTSTVTISPVTSGILMRFAITSVGATVTPPLTGTVPTDASGIASLLISATGTGGNDMVTVAWSFENASDGTGSDNQVFTAGGC
jgi:hypothetical protein